MTTSPPPPPLRIGFVPEHFSIPLLLATRTHALPATLVPFPSGSGHMIAALRAGDVDAAVGLTEAWVAGLGRVDTHGAAPDDGGYRIVGSYVASPLRWSINVAAPRDISSLAASRVGVSRLGSGSHVMSSVLSQMHGLATPPTPVVLDTFANLRAAVTDPSHATPVDFFLWERTTTRAEDARLAAAEGRAAPVLASAGILETPWPSWMVVASTRLLAEADGWDRVADMLDRLTLGIRSFEADTDAAVRIAVEELGYRDADVREWLEAVRFVDNTRVVDPEVVAKCVATLQGAGVLSEGRGIPMQDMILDL
jgi:hypothetical protein